MNILCLDQFSELGGAQRCLLDLLPGLVAEGWNVHVAAPGEGDLHTRARQAGAAASTIRLGAYTSGRKTVADLARFAIETPRLANQIGLLARRTGADLVYVNGPRVLPAASLAAQNGLRILFHSHSLLSGTGLTLAGRAIERSRAIAIAACRFVAQPLEQYVAGGVRVIYNGVREMEKPRPARAGGEFRIGVIGRISPEKGQAAFLRAADRFLSGRTGAGALRFVICGAALFGDDAACRYTAEVERLAQGLPVEFTGWTEDIETVLARLDLLVVPSAAVEATPRVILEAFAAGVPVVAFASGGIPEIVQDGVTGMLVKERSAEALAAAIGAALETPERIRAMAAAAREKARREFSLQRYRAQIVATIRESLPVVRGSECRSTRLPAE